MTCFVAGVGSRGTDENCVKTSKLTSTHERGANESCRDGPADLTSKTKCELMGAEQGYCGNNTICEVVEVT